MTPVPSRGVTPVFDSFQQRPQALQSTERHVCCALSEFLTDRVLELNEMVVFNGDAFGVVHTQQE